MTLALAQEYFTKITACNTKEEVIVLVEEYALLKVNTSNKSFINHLTFLNNAIKTIEVVPEHLKEEYNGHVNHVALSHSYKLGKTQEEFKAKFKDSLKPTKEKVVKENKKPIAAKVADVLDAEKFINLAHKLLNSDDWRDIGMGLSMLTGLRQADTFFYTKLEAENEYSMLVTSLSKKRDSKQNDTYRIPVFYDSNEIERGYDRLRTIKPFHELHAIAIEEGLASARAQFNNNYSTTIIKRFNEVCREFLPDGDDNYHSLRGCFSSIWYWIMDARKVSPKDAMEFSKNAISHDSDQYVLKYLKIRFENLPTLPETVFETPYTEIEKEVLADEFVTINLTKMLSYMSLETQSEFAVSLRTTPNLAKTLAKQCELAHLQRKIMHSSQTKLEPTTSQKVAQLIKAAIKYNNANTVKFSITPSSIQRLGETIFKKEPDKKTIVGVIELMNFEIKHCHTINQIDDRTNLSLRNRDKMALVVEKIQTIYESV